MSCSIFSCLNGDPELRETDEDGQSTKRDEERGERLLHDCPGKDDEGERESMTTLLLPEDRHTAGGEDSVRESVGEV